MGPKDQNEYSDDVIGNDFFGPLTPARVHSLVYSLTTIGFKFSPPQHSKPPSLSFRTQGIQIDTDPGDEGQ